MKKLKFLLLAIVLFGLSGCIIADGVIPYITLTEENVELEVGDVVQVEFDTNFPTGIFTYTSSNEAVFTVANGIVSGVGVGEATLTIKVLATENTPEASAIVNISVVDGSTDEEDPPLVVETVTIVNGDQNLKVGESIIFRANYGASTYLGDDIIWMSNNSQVASIDATGILTANQPGTATIIAIVNNKSDTVTVTVRADDVVVVNPTSLVINGSNFVNIDDSVVLTATPDQGVITGLVWSSNNQAIATV
ncbi:MAG: Ig-like domain-containing protein, partial [Bacilli bacterium]|nr:Ig-like domain-containing protein [Bacilli bacterium]